VFCSQFEADCCLCSAIECGFGMFGTPCTEFYAGNKGVYGVGDVKLAGSLSDGLMVSCFGTESCALSTLLATNVRALECKGDRSCEGATVRITDPFSEFRLHCSGKAACRGLSIHIDFTGPPAGYMCAPGITEELQLGAIECLNDQSCHDMLFTMDNTGCYKVALRKLQCIHQTSCIDTKFQFIGDIAVQECELGASGMTASGLSKCYENLREYQCSKPSSCLGSTKTILNPATSFEFKCGDVSSCESANFHFEFDGASTVSQISGFVFGGRHSARDATFSFENRQGTMLDVDKIDCSGEGSCSGTTFVTGHNVQIGEIVCSSTSCPGCTVKLDANDVGYPCDPRQSGGGGAWQQQSPWNTPAAVPPGPWVSV